MKKNILSASILAALTLTGCNSSDSSSDSSITAPIIKPANSIPVAKHDIALVGQFDGSQNQVIDVDVLANDSDADNDNLIIIEAKAAYGDVQIESNQISYRGIEKTPSGRDVISYTIEDSNGAIASSSVSVFAAPDNDNGFGQNPDKGNDNGFGQDVIDPNNDNGFGQNPDQGSDNGFSYDMPLQTESFNLQLRANEAFDLTKAILAHVGSKTASIADVSAELGRADIMQSDKGSMSLRVIYKYDCENHDGVQDTVTYAVEDKFGNVGINTINIDIVETPDIGLPTINGSDNGFGQDVIDPNNDNGFNSGDDFDGGFGQNPDQGSDNGFGQDDNIVRMEYDLADSETFNDITGLYELPIPHPLLVAGWKIKSAKALYGAAELVPTGTGLILYQQAANHYNRDILLMLVSNPDSSKELLLSYNVFDSSALIVDKPSSSLPPVQIDSNRSLGPLPTGENVHLFLYEDKPNNTDIRIDTICQKLAKSDKCDILIPYKKMDNGFILSDSQMSDDATISVVSTIKEAEGINLLPPVESNKLTVGTDIVVDRTIDTVVAAKPMYEAMKAAGDSTVSDVFSSVFNSDGSLVDDVKFETYGSTSIIRADNPAAPSKIHNNGADYQQVTVMNSDKAVKVFVGDDFVISKDGSTMVFLSTAIKMGSVLTSQVYLVDLKSEDLKSKPISGLNSTVPAIQDDKGYLPQGEYYREGQLTFDTQSRLHISDDGKHVAYLVTSNHNQGPVKVFVNGWAKQEGTGKYKRTSSFNGSAKEFTASSGVSEDNCGIRSSWGSTIDGSKLYFNTQSNKKCSYEFNLDTADIKGMYFGHIWGGITDNLNYNSENKAYQFIGEGSRPTSYGSNKSLRFQLINKETSDTVFIPGAAGFPMLGKEKVAIMDVGVDRGELYTENEDNFTGIKTYDYKGQELSRFSIDGLACYSNSDGCNKGVGAGNAKAYPVSFAAEGNGFRVVTSSERNGKGKINTYLFN